MINLPLDSMWEAVLQCDTRYDALRSCKRCRPDLDRPSGNPAEICFAVGFRSLSGFYAALRAHTGHSPGQHKRQYNSTRKKV